MNWFGGQRRDDLPLGRDEGAASQGDSADADILAMRGSEGYNGEPKNSSALETMKHKWISKRDRAQEG